MDFMDSGQVDNVLIRKLILGNITELPHGKSWRFMPQEYVFPNPDNPFEPPIHILGIEPFDSPYKIIAADANQDGKVTSLDIKILRNLIQGNIDKLPYGISWRFVPYFYVFPKVQAPFSNRFPEKIEVSNTEDPMPTYFNFIGVKIGDVDFSADPN